MRLSDPRKSLEEPGSHASTGKDHQSSFRKIPPNPVSKETLGQSSPIGKEVSPMHLIEKSQISAYLILLLPAGYLVRTEIDFVVPRAVDFEEHSAIGGDCSAICPIV